MEARQIVIEFPENKNREAITKGIYSGSAVLTEILDDSRQLDFTGCNANSFEVKLDNVSDLQGEKIRVKAVVNGTDTNLFVGIVDTCELQTDRRHRVLIAYDELYSKAEINVAGWYNNIFSKNSKISCKDFRKSLLEYAGLTQEDTTLINDNVMLEKTFESDTVSFITILGMICQMNAVFGNINRNGVFEYITLGKSVRNLSTNYRSNNSTAQEYLVDYIDKVQIRTTDDDIGVIYGTGSNALIVQGNYLLYGMSESVLNGIAKNIYNKVKDITYTPVEIKTLVSDLSVNLGDTITLNTNSGLIIRSYAMKNVLSGIQIFQQTISANGDKERAETVEDTNVSIKELKYKSTELKKSIDGVSSKVTEIATDLSKNYSTTTDMKSAIEQSASGIKQEVSKNYQSIARAKSDLKEAKSYADEVGNNVDAKAKGYADTAETNAKDDTIAKLKAYSTTAQMNTAISQSADSIKLEVNKETDIKLEEVVSNIDIGATNLLAGSIIYQENTKLAITATKNAYYENHKEIYADLKENETYTINCQTDTVWGTENISAELMCTNESIVNKVHLFTLYTNYSYSQTNIDKYSAAGYTDKWNCRAVGNLKVNDIARILVYNATTKTNNYILTKVIKIESDNRTVTATSLGVCMTTYNIPLLISNYSYSQTNIDKYSAADYSGSWAVTSISGITGNNIVQIRVYNTTTKEYNYIIVKVTKLNTDEKRVTATSLGACVVGSSGGIVCKTDDAISLKCRASGGAGELQYKYEGNVISTGETLTLQDWSDNDSYTYTVNSDVTGSLDITVGIKDRGGNVVTSNSIRLFVNATDDGSGYQYPSTITVVDTIKAWLVDASDSNNSIKIYPTPYTFRCEKSGKYYVSLGVNKNGSTHSFWNFKLEKGNKATDWSPSPYDIDSKFNDYSSKEETKSAIDAASDNINLSVTKKISESNSGNLDEKEGYDLISNATQKSYCVLDYIKGYTTQSATPTPDNPIDIQNMSASFDIASENKDKSEMSKAYIELASELCAGESIIRADKNIVVGGINVKKGDWYVERCVNKLKFNYEANIILVKSVGTYNSFKITPAKLVKAKASTVQYSNKYRYLNDESDVEHFYVNTDGCIYVFDSAADVSAFKSKLAAKALEIEYQTTSKSYEALNDDSQAAMHNVVTYEDYTKIYVNLTTKPYIKGTFKSALYGETVESKAEIDMQSKCIVLKVDNNGNVVSVAIGEDAKDGNVVKISGNMVVGGQIKSSNYVAGSVGSLLDLLTGAFKSKNLSWDKYGNLWAKSANITGYVTADSGFIGNWQILSGGALMAETTTGTAPGTLNRIYIQPFLKDEYDETWVFSSQHYDIDSSGKVADEGWPYWRITGGGDFLTKGDVWIEGNAAVDSGWFTGKHYPQIYGNDDYLHISAVNNNKSGVVVSNVTGDVAFRPATDNHTDLGLSSKRWRNIYTCTPVIVTSDRNKKTNINALDDELTKRFIRGLIPYSYKMIDGTSDRTHTGLIAQDIEELLNQLDIDTKDFAGFIKSPRTKEIEEVVLDEEGKPVLDENGNEKTKVRVETIKGEYDYALRYEEFISPLIRFVQLQDKDISELKETIKQQQQSIDELTELVKKLLPDNIDNLSESEVSEE